MKIYGIVTANHDGHAHKILMELVNEGVLEHFTLDGHENIPGDEVDEKYDAVVDQDGCLNLAEDYGDCPLSEVTAGAHTFGFEAEYLEA